MSLEAMLAELLFAGFFAVACLRAAVPSAAAGGLRLGDLFRLPGRLERLRRSRWQWAAALLLLLVLRLQQGVPLVLELTVFVQFLIFLALPARAERLSPSTPA
ncbi:MAG TPA: hypothetical protein VMG41_17115 [Gemmatimonadales bacterium]|nr:hypothetical protein [Gemmatimonadales bacterium]